MPIRLFAGVHVEGLAEDDRLLEEFKRFEGRIRQQAHSHQDSNEEVSAHKNQYSWRHGLARSLLPTLKES